MSVTVSILLSTVLLQAGRASQNGGAPQLVGPVWVVVEIKGAKVQTDSAPTLQFASDGKLSGRAFCNHYAAVYKTSGNDLSIQPTSITQMSCIGDGKPNLLTDSAFTGMLQQVNRLEIDSGGRLLLHTKNGDTITARRK